MALVTRVEEHDGYNYFFYVWDCNQYSTGVRLLPMDELHERYVSGSGYGDEEHDGEFDSNNTEVITMYPDNILGFLHRENVEFG